MPGNWFSGRRRRGAAKCAATDSIPLTFLRRKKMMPLKYWPGLRYMTMSWTMRGQETGSIGVYTSEDCMRLKYSIKGEAIEQVIEWGWTDNPFGKRRWYGSARFCCRKCWGLTYHSQYEEDWERLSGKAERLRRCLGGKGFISAGDPFNAPPKPKWVRWKTYRAICEKGDRLCFQYAMGFERRCSVML